MQRLVAFTRWAALSVHNVLQWFILNFIEMSTGMIVLSAVLVALLFTPFIFFRDGKEKNRKKALLALLTEMAAADGGHLSVHELWNNAGIGMDTQNAILVFARGEEAQRQTARIRLSQVKSCRVDVVSRTVERKSDAVKIIEGVALELHMKQSGEASKRLVFYDSEVDGFAVSNELRLAELWQTRIREVLGSAPERVARIAVA